MFARQTTSPVPCTTSASPTRAPSASSNADRCEALGLRGAVPAVADGLLETLALLGGTADVVLDAMPESVAVPFALAQRAAPWASAWLRGLSAEQLRAAGADAVLALLDASVPVGAGVEQETLAALSFEHLVLGAGSALRVVRTAEGLSLDAEGDGTVGLALGLGVGVSGVDGTTVLGAGADADLARVARVSLGWDLDRAALLDLVLQGADTVRALVTGGAALASLADAVTRWTASHAPDRARVALRDVGAVDAGLGAALAGTDAGAEVGAACALGVEDGRVQLEAVCAADLEAAVRLSGASWLLALFGGALPRLDWTRAQGLRVRVSARLDAGRPCDAMFEVERTARTQRGSEVETVELTDPRALAATLAGMCGRARSASDVPDVALRRGRTLRIDDPDTLRAHPEWSWGPRHGVWSLADVLVLDHSVVLSAEVRVDAEAVQAACGTLDRVRAAEDPQAELLDLERAVAAAALGESACADGAVDLADGAAHVEVRASSEARLRLAAGLGLDADAIAAQAGVRGQSDTTLVHRAELDAPSEAFRALLD